MKICRYLLFVLLVTIQSIFFYSCSSHSYQSKSITSSAKFPGVIEQANKDKRYLILQSGINVYNITSADLDSGKQLVTVTLDKVDSSHLVYLRNPEIRRSKGRAGEKGGSSELYIYMKDSASYTLDEPHTISLNKVGRMDLSD